jgi:hypothetical protein
MGIITIIGLTNSLATNKATKDQAIERILEKEFRLLQSNDEMEVLIKSFEHHNYVIVQDGSKYQVCEHNDLLNYLVN